MRTQNLILFILAILFAGCGKDRMTFNLKTIRLNDYHGTKASAENLYLKVLDPSGSTELAHTGKYPANLTLPATFKVYPSLPMKLYKSGYYVQLWGDSAGYIAAGKINMDDYKIIFPIDMEVKNDSLNVSVQGSWE